LADSKRSSAAQVSADAFDAGAVAAIAVEVADLEAAVFDDQTIVDGAALGALGPEVAVAGTRGGAGDLRAGRELTVRALAGVAARRVGHVGRAVRIHDAVDHAGRALGGSRSARAAAGCSARRSAACCSAACCSA